MGAPLQAYRFKSVLFGATSSPFLLQVTLNLHLKTGGGQHWETILNNFYVDNLIGVTDEEETILEIYSEANAELNKADMPLRDWSTNSPALTKCIIADTGKLVPFKNDQNLLGLNWSVSEDTLSVKSLNPQGIVKLTRRILLARVSSLFDPLGLVSPLTIKGKLLVQQAWRTEMGWDEELPEAITKEWPG